ncbi:5'-methylthioadenosine/S-adenosylhomocysteine nucleosidase family protein [Saccharomonospora iraqiensis]|uniref:5'-methylthioadenosine/S-adenosylhomocysteine nucleosidase family protein n=1 Tax=Saccharomonospora iraqiensis TaxID=52698 RepID=UPI00022E756B|nr:5'-methylthioadenosine/S-adenosylhomocysteine nucleosidase [Saccharomonospora iraqiensis]
MWSSSVVILTALDVEYEAVRQRLSEPDLYRHTTGTRFEVGTLPGGACRVALALVGKGNHASAVLAERAINEFEPAAVLFVGVAGGLWPNVALGDVVFGTHVYAYHGGTSEDDGLKARPRVWEVPHEVNQVAHHLARSGDWQDHHAERASAARVHFGAIAAGEVVHDSRISYEARWMRQHYNDALAIEMEAAGVAQAGHLNGSPVAVVRGISDRADGNKAASDGANWQARAAANAAAFAATLAAQLTGEGEDITMRDRRRPEQTGFTVHNTATGAGQVGIQAAQVTGSTVHLGASVGEPVRDLVAELSALRELLLRKRSVGDLDEATYEAARAELDIADKALADETPEGQSRFVTALKKLRGLVEETAELAAKVAALITAARGLA